jgi:putative ABC transport system ATP-binding protein
MLNLWKLTGDIRSGAPFFQNLREMVAPEKAFIKLILVNSVAISILSLVIPVSVQSIITNLGILNVTQPIVVMSLVLFVILVFSGGIQVIQFHAIEVLRRRLFLRYGQTILQNSTRYLDTHFQSINRPQLSKRFVDVLLAQSSMIIFFVDGIGFGVQYIISMGLLCLYHPYFLMFGIFITALLIGSWMMFGPKGVEAGTPEADTRYNAMGWIDEVMRARPLFMSKNGRRFAEKHFVNLLEEWSIKRGNLFSQQFGQAITLQAINAFVYAALLGLGYLLVQAGELSVGQLVAAFIVVTMLLSSLPRLQNFYSSVYDYSTNLDKLAEFWSHPLEKSHPSSELPVGALEISFEKADFDDNVHLNFNIAAGQRVYAYVRSFAAARTMNRSLEGFLPPKTGELRIGGKRLDDIDFSELRGRVAVLGIGRFFSASIRDNMVGFMDHPASTTEIEDALELVGLLEKVKQLPQGLETELLPNGYPLSISESIALQGARAIVTKPSLVLVTSDFDKMSHEKRRAVKKALLDKKESWTVLFLSQRVLKGDFDRYLVLERAGAMELDGELAVLREVEKHE